MSSQIVAFVHTILTCGLLDKLKTVLILAPVNTLSNWQDEFQKWIPNTQQLPVLMMEDIKENNMRERQLRAWVERDRAVFIMGYKMYRLLVQGKHIRSTELKERFRKYLQNPGPDLVVLDEGHLIGNSRTETSKYLKKLRTRRRIILTGTPLQNNLSEYHCMVEFVRKNILGSERAFSSRFMVPIMRGQYENSSRQDVKIMKQRVHVLQDLIKPFVHRRDFHILTSELPPRREYAIYVRMSPLQRSLYRQFLTYAKQSAHTIHFFSVWHTLMCVWNHPRVVTLSYQNKRERSVTNEKELEKRKKKLQELAPGKALEEIDEADLEAFQLQEQWWTSVISEETKDLCEESGKMVVLLDILERSIKLGEKVLVFSQSLVLLDVIEEILKNYEMPTLKNKDQKSIWRRNFDYFRLEGDTPTSQRSAMNNLFNDPSSNYGAYLISVKVGGGCCCCCAVLCCVVCCVVCLYDGFWLSILS